MTIGLCASCGAPMGDSAASRLISAAICDECRATLAAGSAPERCREIMRGINAPVLLMQPDPRLVYAANDAALALFGRSPREAEGHRGGEVFGCIHSFTVAGCGKDVNCDTCPIKAGIVSSFGGGEATGISATLVIRQASDIAYAMTISTEPVGAYALVRIDQFEKSPGPA
jgi:hypothetical protein